MTPDEPRQAGKWAGALLLVIVTIPLTAIGAGIGMKIGNGVIVGNGFTMAILGGLAGFVGSMILIYRTQGKRALRGALIAFAVLVVVGGGACLAIIAAILSSE